jgi:hypothetical protein
MATAAFPTVIGLPAVLVAVWIGVTDPTGAPVLTTYAVALSGVIAMASGPGTVLMAFPGCR